jgi:hypothetical protein
MLRALAAASVAFLLAAPGDPRLGSELRAGMQLIYASGGRDQPPWIVVAVDRTAVSEPGADCVRVRIRRQAAQTEAPEERLCIEGGTLYAWNAARSERLAQRPVGEHMDATFPRPNGDTIRYITGVFAEETIGTYTLRVLPTTVLTVDASGKPKRRLVERYAIALTTATGGRFEAPDPAAPGGWRTEQSFELREIR